MIRNFNLIRNIGKYDSVATGGQLDLTKLSFIYAENGRGKTTLASILRSLSNNDALPISERIRLGGQGAPHVVISDDNGVNYVFQNNGWNSAPLRIAIFDDYFVDENICSGVAIEAGHRQSLHELIIGHQGVALNEILQQKIGDIETHNQILREKAAQITADIRYGLNVDDFCALEYVEQADQRIQEAEKNLAAAQNSAAIQGRQLMQGLSLPEIDIEGITYILQKSLPDIEVEATEIVQEHISLIGQHGEEWLAQGMQIVTNRNLQQCPFCRQGLDASDIVGHYRSVFSEAYSCFKEEITEFATFFRSTNREELQTAFERNYRRILEDKQFWSGYMDVPNIDLDTASINSIWRQVVDKILSALRTKLQSPLEPIGLSKELADLLPEYNQFVSAVQEVNATIEAINDEIVEIKESSSASDVSAIQNDLYRYKAVRARYSPEVAPLCEEYLTAKQAKTLTEEERNAAREALNQYREQVFPRYQESINSYLERFHAGFRLANVSSVNNRSGSSCNYNIVIDNFSVPLSSNQDGVPTFKSTLSSGDRNTLALAFFFSSIEQNPHAEDTIVVIDDPMTSLDDHRALTTIQQIGNLVNSVHQVIVLSHSKPFLCSLWNSADSSIRSAIKITRSGTSSTFSLWDVNQDCITEHDRNYAKVVEFIENGNSPDERSIAAALRPILESYVRVTCPVAFPPGSLLGPFLHTCQQFENTPDQIMDGTRREELRRLLDYANQFHHDTNPAWQSVYINEQELLGFAQRTINYVSI